MPVHHDSTVGAAFLAAADRHPGHPAVVTAGGEVSYAALADAAGGVATALEPTGAAPGTDADGAPPRVGLLLDHGADMVAAILGAATAGWCYVPLDPTFPVARLQAMVRRVSPAVLLAHRAHAATAQALADGAPTPAAVHTVEELGHARARPAPVDPDTPVYVLFTSGSTGAPKGVTHTHRSVLHGIANHVRHLGVSAGDRQSLLTPFSYDMSVTDLYGAVLSGAAVVPCDLRRQGVPRVADALRDHAVTLHHSTPTVFRYVLDYLAGEGQAVADAEERTAREEAARVLPTVRAVLLGGEPATRADLAAARRHCAPDCHFVNGYGASEASFTVQLHLPAHAPPPAAGREVLPIGTALPGYEAVLLDPEGQPLAESATGPAELGVRSPYLGRGYWGDPAATAAVFTEGGALYRTGDLVRREDGTLHYEGRADRQVKVNGQRLELGEIEAHLSALPGVARAAATGSATSHGSVRVDAYVQPARGHTPAVADLRAALADRLPAPLVPQTVQVLPQLPLTVSGKVDVAALPPPPAVDARPVADGDGHRDRPAVGGEGDQPRGATEELVAGTWCAVLGLDRVSRRVSFFDAGGCSDALTRVQYRLTRLSGVDVPLVELLAAPTVAGMARQLDGAPSSAGGGGGGDGGPAGDGGAGGQDRLAAVAARVARRKAGRREDEPREAQPREAERRGGAR